MQVATTDHDAELKRLIQSASRWFEKACGYGSVIRAFIPYREVKLFDYEYEDFLYLPDDLLQVYTLTNGDGSVMAAGSYFLYPANTKPARWIEPSTEHDSFSYSGTMQQAIALDGLWGFSNSYRSSGDTVQSDPLSSSATSLVVTNGTNFDIGMTILIESEYLFVTAISTNTLTVERGDNGSTAASHIKTTAISIMEPINDIELGTRILVSRWFSREAAAWTEVTGIPEAGFQVTGVVPTEVSDIAEAYKRAPSL